VASREEDQLFALGYGKMNDPASHGLQCWWEKPLVVALIPIVGDSCSPCGTVVFMIIAQRRLSTLTQYLMWFGKLPTSTGEINIIRDRERIQHAEEDHIHSTPISHCYIG